MSVKRALVCAPRMLEHDREGGARRIYQYIALLRKAGWAVTFNAPYATEGAHYARAPQRRGVAVYAGRDSLFAGDEYLLDPPSLIVAARFDIAILAFWPIALHYLPILRSLSPDTRVIVDSVDLHFLRNARGVFGGGQGGDRSLDRDDAAEIVGELNAYAAADAVLTVSAKEAALINDLVADPALAHVVPDTETIAPSVLPFEARRGMVFVGNFRHPPNVEAVSYLRDEILPRLDVKVLADHPITIVGNDPHGALGRTIGEASALHAVGWVPSIIPYLERSRISLIPLLSGAGTKRKLMQALLIGTPSVSTSIGIEGLDVRDGEHVLVADDAPAFAAAVARLLTDATLWQRLAARGRARIVEAHSEEMVGRRFRSVLDAVMVRAPKTLQAAMDPAWGDGGGLHGGISTPRLS
jgi:glycosyltransferase involved in cell wall biosynthesis